MSTQRQGNATLEYITLKRLRAQGRRCHSSRTYIRSIRAASSKKIIPRGLYKSAARVYIRGLNALKAPLIKVLQILKRPPYRDKMMQRKEKILLKKSAYSHFINEKGRVLQKNHITEHLLKPNRSLLLKGILDALILYLLTLQAEDALLQNEIRRFLDG